MWANGVVWLCALGQADAVGCCAGHDPALVSCIRPCDHHYRNQSSMAQPAALAKCLAAAGCSARTPRESALTPSTPELRRKATLSASSVASVYPTSSAGSTTHVTAPKATRSAGALRTHARRTESFYTSSGAPSKKRVLHQLGSLPKRRVRVASALRHRVRAMTPQRLPQRRISC